MSHRSAGAFLPSLVLVALLACTPEPPVALGVALSGSFVDAARLAIDEASGVGGVPTIDTVMASEFSNRASLALGIAESLLARPRLVAVVGHSNSAASLAAAPVYNSRQVVQIAPTSTAEGYTHAGPFSFRLVPPDAEQGRFLARAIDSLFPGGARVAVLFVNDDYGRGLRDAMAGHLDPQRFPVVFQQPHSDDEFVSPPPDRAERVRSTVISMLEARPTLVLWLGRATTFQLYLQTLRVMNDTLPILGGDALSSWRDRDIGSGEWDGVRFADFLDLDASGALRDFRKRYLARFGLEAGTPEVLTYDAMSLLLSAIRDGARTGEEVRQWLNSLGSPQREPYYGISGRIAFDSNGDIARSYVLVTISAPAGDGEP